MTANVIVTVEREFDAPRERVFRAWTQPEELAQWRGSPGWHVETDTVSGELALGGRHHHVKVRDADPSTRVGTDGVYTEYLDSALGLASQYNGTLEAPPVLCRLLVSHGGWRHAEEDRSGAEGARGAAGA